MRYTISGLANGSWYIHCADGPINGWLSNDTDDIIGADGCDKAEWEGYYPTRVKAEERLERHKNGLSPRSTIRIGGE